MASALQTQFLNEVIDGIVAAYKRLDHILKDIPIGLADKEKMKEKLRDELSGVAFGICVILDGGSGLADNGLIRIIDEEGNTFDRNLHEIILYMLDKRLDEGNVKL
jgi:hypothetical protein